MMKLSKKLLSRCNTIKKEYSNGITITTLFKLLDTNKDFRTDYQHQQAIEYLKKYIKVVQDAPPISKEDPIIIENADLDDEISDEIGNNSIEYNKEEYLSNNDDNDVVLDDQVQMYLRSLELYPMMTDEEFQKVLDERDYGDEETQKKARNKIVCANLRLVIPVAKKFTYYNSLSFMDIIQFGNTGLIRAAEMYQRSFNTSFSTYAMYWIKQGIYRGISNESRIIRIPVHTIEAAIKIRRASKELERILHRPPVISEITNYLNDNRLYENSPFTDSDVVMCINFYKDNVSSLNAPVLNDTDDNESEFGDFIPNNEPSPEDIVVKENTSKCIRDILNDETILTKMESDVIKMAFGINYEKAHTLQEIGQYFGLSRERIRQIKEKAIRKLRFCPRSGQILKSLVDYEINK